MTNGKAIYFLDMRKKELLEKQDSKQGFEFIKALAEIHSLEMAIKTLEQADVFKKIREEIEVLLNANPSYTHTCDVVDREDVLDIIDKYRKGDAE